MASSTRSSTRSGAPATASGLRIRLLSSSTFRLTLVHLLVFGTSALALLTFIFLLGAQYMERQSIETVEAEIQGLREQYALQGLDGLEQIVAQRSAAGPESRGIYLMTNAQNEFVVGNVPRWPPSAQGSGGNIEFAIRDRLEDGSERVRPVIGQAFVLQSKDGERQGQLFVGRDVSDMFRTKQRLRDTVMWGGAVMVLFGLAGGYAMSRYLLNKLEVINETTTKIMAGNLSERVQVESVGDEFDDLARNLNAMLERIERLLTGMREVTDNIAHDLRTPLNRIRSRIEVALMNDLDGQASRELMEATVRDADGLIETFNALLNIARAESGAQRSEWEEVDLHELVRDMHELYEPLADDKGMTIVLDGRDPCPVMGNRQLIAQAIANLLDNAIKYSPENSEVRLLTRPRPRPSLCVADRGPGIPHELRDKALERFTRLAPERTGPGNGLGLSLVNAVARLHDAEIALEDNAPGLLVTLTFRSADRRTEGTRAAGPRGKDA